ncbi:MAG: hypothetical protein K2X39_07675 [Silvanigrellaceae bacterium]|nr:hypothetical protein [Silvanigrellaceae bacterium]
MYRPDPSKRAKPRSYEDDDDEEKKPLNPKGNNQGWKQEIGHTNTFFYLFVPLSLVMLAPSLIIFCISFLKDYDDQFELDRHGRWWTCRCSCPLDRLC